MRLALAAVVLAGCAGSPDGPATRPFAGQPHAIPGVVEAEHFDEGPEGVAFQDADQKKDGDPYRAGNVDIEKRSDASNGFGLGWTREGEWLVYTVEVAEAGAYTIDIPVASKKTGGIFHLEFDGEDKTGPIQVPDTGGWQNLKTITRTGIKLKKGRQVMKLVMDKDGESRGIGDIDLFRFSK